MSIIHRIGVSRKSARHQKFGYVKSECKSGDSLSVASKYNNTNSEKTLLTVLSVADFFHHLCYKGIIHQSKLLSLSHHFVFVSLRKSFSSFWRLCGMTALSSSLGRRGKSAYTLLVLLQIYNSLLVFLHDQNKSGFFGGPVFFQPIRAIWKVFKKPWLAGKKPALQKMPLLFWSC